MSDDERELTSQEAMDRVVDFVVRGRTAQERVDQVHVDLGAVDYTVYRCACGFACHEAKTMLAHQRRAHR